MAVAYASAGAMAGSAGTTSLSVSFPATVNSGDIAIIIAVAFKNITLPASFTSEAQENHAPSATNFRMGWKRCDGTEDSSSVNVTLEVSGQVWSQIYIFSGAISSGTPYEGYSAVTGADNAGSLTTPAITSTVADTLGVLVASDQDNITFTPASGFTEQVDNNSTAGIDCAFTVNTIAKPSAGTTAAGTIGSSTATFGGYVVFGFALKVATDTGYTYFLGESPTVPAYSKKHRMTGY